MTGQDDFSTSSAIPVVLQQLIELLKYDHHILIFAYGKIIYNNIRTFLAESKILQMKIHLFHYKSIAGCI